MNGGIEACIRYDTDTMFIIFNDRSIFILDNIGPYNFNPSSFTHTHTCSQANVRYFVCSVKLTPTHIGPCYFFNSFNWLGHGVASIFLLFVYFPNSLAVSLSLFNVITLYTWYTFACVFQSFVFFFTNLFNRTMWKLDFKPIKSIRNVTECICIATRFLCRFLHHFPPPPLWVFLYDIIVFILPENRFEREKKRR